MPVALAAGHGLPADVSSTGIVVMYGMVLLPGALVALAVILGIVLVARRARTRSLREQGYLPPQEGGPGPTQQWDPPGPHEPPRR